MACPELIEVVEGDVVEEDDVSGGIETDLLTFGVKLCGFWMLASFHCRKTLRH